MESSSVEEEDGLVDLSPEATEKLAQLQDLTGIEDLEICRALLESKNWDLEATAREHLDIPPMARSESPEEEISINAFEERRNNNEGNNGPSTSVSLISYGYAILTYPFRFTYEALHLITSYIYSFFTSSSPSSPAADVADFKAKFQAKYEYGDERLRLPFLSRSYSAALDLAKRDLKFLVVYLHSPKHFLTDDFCLHTLKSSTFTNFWDRRKNELLLWGCSVETREGYTVSQACREYTYPFLAVVVLRQNRMMIVGRIEGILAPDELVRTLDAIIADNEAFVVAARVDREERNLTQNLREEQDAAFQESLRQDQERERLKREREERIARDEAERQNEVTRIAERKQRIHDLKIDLVNLIPDEPAPQDPDVVRLVIKLPEGQRLERKFKANHSLRVLYFYVFCHPESPEEFDVTTNFPRKILRCKPSFINDIIEEGKTLREVDTAAVDKDILTFEKAGLGKSVMLFVNNLDA